MRRIRTGLRAEGLYGVGHTSIRIIGLRTECNEENTIDQPPATYRHHGFKIQVEG